MCTKPEQPEVYRPLAEMNEQLHLEPYAWIGVRLIHGLLENA